MKVTEKKKEKDSVILEAVASVDDVEKAFEAASIAFAQQTGLKPEANKSVAQIAEEQLDIKDLDGIVSRQVIEYLTPFAVDKRNLTPAYPARVTKQAHARRGSELPFTLEVALKTNLTLSSYDPVTITIPPFVMNDLEVDKQIAQMAESYADFVAIEPRPAQSGDSCLLNILAQENNVDVPELSIENTIYQLGSNMISKDFDTQIIGMSAPDEKAFTIEYLSNEPGSSPRTIDFVVTLVEVRERVVPTIDDEWIRINAPAAKTLENFKHLIRSEFEKEYRVEYENMKRQRATAELAKRYTGGISDEAMVSMQQVIIGNLRAQMQNEGKNFDEYIDENGGEQQFNLMTMMQSKDTLAQGYALDALFIHEGLSLTDDDIREACKSFDPENPDMIRKQMEYTGCGFMLQETASRLKASKWLVESAQIIEEGSSA